MSATEATAHELTDPELISRVRDGDVAAYGTLFSRHVEAANRLARLLVGASDADDLVSEAFVKVLNVLLAGGGPDVAFRAYLLTAVRRLHIDKTRSQQKLTTTDDMTVYDPGVPFTDTAIAGFEGGAAAKAFASLPERWQLVLWHLEVENQKPADIAPLLGMSANSVSALAYRAREGLRQAFLNMHSGDLVNEDCRTTNDLLGAYVRHALSRRDTAKVEDHLDHCRRCTAVYLELAEVNSSLAGLLGPVLLGAAAAGYLGGGAVVGTGAGAGAMTVIGRLRDLAMTNLPATAATVTAVGVAGITTFAVLNHGPHEQTTTADAPSRLLVAPSSSSAPPSSHQSSTAPTTPGTPTPTTPAPTRTPGTVAAGTTTNFSAVSGPVATSGSGGNGNGGNGGSNNGGHHGDGGNNGGPGPGGHTTSPGDPSSPSGPTGPTEPTGPTGPTGPTQTPPTSPPPPPPSADVGVHASLVLDGHHHAKIFVEVTGVPKDQKVHLQASTTTGDLYSLNGPACQRTGGHSWSCTATPFLSHFGFGSNSQSRTTITFSVSPPAGWTDPSPGNNSISITCSRDDDHHSG